VRQAQPTNSLNRKEESERGKATNKPRGVRNPSRHTVQRGARSERVRPTGGFRKAVNQQNPLKAGREGTSDPENGPASESALERETEPMAEAPSGGTSPTRKWVRQSKDLWSADARLMGARQGRRETRCQRPGKPARPGSQIPHGVESAPTADKEQRWNLGTRPRFRSLSGTDGRSDRRARAAGAEPA
jgi:hypothetical protein